MKKPNTKKHWTALAVARYYDKFGTAARARDLYPNLDRIFDKPDQLVSALSKLNSEDYIDAMTVKSSSSNGMRNVYAYYPTPITIEELRDIGLPTKFPDGEYVSDELDLELPTARVSTEDGTPPAPNTERPGLKYAWNENAQRKAGEPTIDKPKPGIADEPDAVMPEMEAADDEDEPVEYDLDGLDPEAVELALDTLLHICDNCGEMFDSGKALGGHRSHCLRDEEQDEDDAIPVGHDLAYMESQDTPPTWNWWDVSNRLDRKADRAANAGLGDLARTYREFASLAMERDFGKDNLLTPELALKLLGDGHDDLSEAAASAAMV